MSKEATHYQFTFLTLNGYTRATTEIMAEATVSPHFVITPRTFTDGTTKGWCVTHVYTGFAAMSGIESKRVARLCAAVLDSLLPWQEVTIENASQVAREHGPDWFRGWMRDVLKS